jgi:hypothetical protein
VVAAARLASGERPQNRRRKNAHDSGDPARAAPTVDDVAGAAPLVRAGAADFRGMSPAKCAAAEETRMTLQACGAAPPPCAAAGPEEHLAWAARWVVLAPG